MDILNVLQGSPEWAAIRRNYLTASEASAALGQSKYMNRTELMQQKATGVEKDIDAFTQELFDKGHESEAQARPHAERIIGSDLYPITATREVEGLPLLVSLDGATLDEEVIFEHKLWSEPLAAEVRAGTLDPHYTIQMDQQLLVSGAKKCLFMVSDGTEQNMVWCWYESSQEKFDSLIAGWKQFKADLTEYKPREIAEKPQAEAILQLPALAIQIRGEVTLSNLPKFKEAADHFIASIKTDLQTDQDFSDAEATVKFCEESEKKLALAKESALSQTASIDELLRTIDHIRDQLRDKRLMLDKLVTKEKAARKDKILVDGKARFAEHVAALEAETKPIRLMVAQPDFVGAAKNKRTLASLHDAVDSELANGKIAADALAKDIRAKLAWCKTNAEGYGFLFSDLQQIIQKPMEDFQMVINSRIKAHKDAEEAKLKAERDRIAEQERIKAEAKVKAELEAQQRAQEAEAKLQAEQALAAAKQSTEGRELSPAAQAINEAEGAQRFAQHHPQLGKRMLNPAPAWPFPEVARSGPPITTGALCALAGDGFSITAAFIQALGITPADRPKEAKSGTYWAAADVPVIFSALAGHFAQLATADNALAA